MGLDDDDAMQTRVQAVLDAQVSVGAETGLQVVVYRQGELIVDAMAGLAFALCKTRLTYAAPGHSTAELIELA